MISLCQNRVCSVYDKRLWLVCTIGIAGSINHICTTYNGTVCLSRIQPTNTVLPQTDFISGNGETPVNVPFGVRMMRVYLFWKYEDSNSGHMTKIWGENAESIWTRRKICWFQKCHLLEIEVWEDDNDIIRHVYDWSVMWISTMHGL